MIEEFPLLKNFAEKQEPYIFDNAQKHQHDSSKQMANDIKKVVDPTFPQIKCFMTHSNIGGHFRLKDKQPQMIQSKVI